MSIVRELRFNVAGDPKDDAPYIRVDNPAGAAPIYCTLGRDEVGGFVAGATPSNRMLALIPSESTGGATVVYAKGKKTFRVILPPLDKPFQAEAGEPPQLPPEYNGDSDKVALHYTVIGTLPRLEIVGRYFRQNGQRFFLNGASGFNALGVYYAEGEAGLRARFIQRQDLGFNAARMWTAFVIDYIGRVIPREHAGFYTDDIPAVSAIAAEYGQYPYWTGLTGPYDQALGGIDQIAEHDARLMDALVKIPYAIYDRRNEYSKDVNQVDASRLVQPPAGLMWSQGSGQQDQDPPGPLGTIFGYHPAGSQFQRKVGKQNFDYGQHLNTPGLDDETVRCEPGGDTTRRHYHDAGACGAFFIASAFFHSAQAKLFEMFSGSELDCAQGWCEGVQSIVAQGLTIVQDGAYHNISDPDVDDPLRVYERVLGDQRVVLEIAK